MSYGIFVSSVGVCSFTNSMTLQAVFMFQQPKGQISIAITLSKNSKIPFKYHADDKLKETLKLSKILTPICFCLQDNVMQN